MSEKFTEKRRFHNVFGSLVLCEHAVRECITLRNISNTKDREILDIDPFPFYWDSLEYLIINEYNKVFEQYDEDNNDNLSSIQILLTEVNDTVLNEVEEKNYSSFKNYYSILESQIWLTLQSYRNRCNRFLNDITYDENEVESSFDIDFLKQIQLQLRSAFEVLSSIAEYECLHITKSHPSKTPLFFEQYGIMNRFYKEHKKDNI